MDFLWLFKKGIIEEVVRKGNDVEINNENMYLCI